jgi:hypothetical protein
VHVAQPLLQSHNRLAIGGEAEVAGLDDAGVYRPHWNLMQRWAFGSAERVGLAARVTALPPAEWLAQPPASVVEPSPHIGRAVGLQPVQIAQGALQADRGSMRIGDGGEATRTNSQADDQRLARGLLRQGQVHRMSVTPQAEQGCLTGGKPEDRLPPQVLVHIHARPRAMAGNGLAMLLQCCNEPHRQSPYPSSFATAWNHSTSGPGR